jgi:hypothetical protein
VWAQLQYLLRPQLGERNVFAEEGRLPSNSVSHMAFREPSSLWIGTGKGLARTTSGGGSWESFRSLPEFASQGIFAIALQGDTVLTSTGFTKDVEGDNVQTGSGFTYSLNNGNTWTHRPQPLDAPSDSIVQYGQNTVRFLPITVPEQNVTFDLALQDSIVWIASWSSGLRKSFDLGSTWERIVLPSDSRSSISPSDSLGRYVMDPRLNNNFLAFSVYVQSPSIIWCGTAGGVNKSTDGGISWTRFTRQNQSAPILANWVIAINGQRLDSTLRIWTTNWVAGSNEQFGVSYSDDGGRIWKNVLPGIRAYAFAFRDSIAYVATEEGIYRTPNGGRSWSASGTIVDRTTGEQIRSSEVFSVSVIGDTVFVGTGDGIAKTVDNASHPFGMEWQVLRAFQPLQQGATTYAYPNPFSPRTDVARIHYATRNAQENVTVEIFDFGMNRVRTIANDAQRSGPREYDEIWDGRDDNSTQVSNGVYFYRVVLNGSEPVWGKIMVLQ